MGFEFGPPPVAGWTSHGCEFGSRQLTPGQFQELERLLEYHGAILATWRGSLMVEGDCEVFCVHPGGGELSKPPLGDRDEWDRLTGLMVTLCDWAGWIAIVEGELSYGATLRCGCGESGFTFSCPQNHPATDYLLDVEVVAPSVVPIRIDTPLDQLRKASTSRAVDHAVGALERGLVVDEPAIAIALLLSTNCGWVDRALGFLEKHGTKSKSPQVLDVRLRRLEQLGDDPVVSKQAHLLRRRE